MMWGITDKGLWKGVVAAELVRAAEGHGPADFGRALETYRRIEAERRQKEVK